LNKLVTVIISISSKPLNLMEGDATTETLYKAGIIIGVGARRGLEPHNVYGLRILGPFLGLKAPLRTTSHTVE
jgi:hypothetical protein